MRRGTCSLGPFGFRGMTLATPKAPFLIRRPSCLGHPFIQSNILGQRCLDDGKSNFQSVPVARNRLKTRRIKTEQRKNNFATMSSGNYAIRTHDLRRRRATQKGGGTGPPPFQILSRNQPQAARASALARADLGSAGAPHHSELGGICSPFITRVSGPSWAKSPTLVS